MKTYRLVPHPDYPPRAVSGVEVAWRADGDEVVLTFAISGAELVKLPPPAPPARADELWKATCVELFWKAAGDEVYLEFNFSPSSRWAAYAFEGYRDGMRDLPIAVEPTVEVMREGPVCRVTATIDRHALSGGPAMAGLSAIVEEADGTRSFWALRHPAGKPDFHHADCFALELPAI